MLVATAGHVDHGKTTLIRALTGVDTDRLPEEKKRGLTIDLGFAYLTTPAGDRIGFIDVPGHEKFIRNMAAGVGGVDLALLIVAADDGVMPQTREHIAILELLGVSHCIVVITRIDLVDVSTIDVVRQQVAEELRDHTMEIVGTTPVSAINNAGIDALQTILYARAATVAPFVPGHFRLAVDRSFSVKGTGTVVTGTVLTGCIAEKEQIRLLPDNRTARIRSVHVNGDAADLASSGQRAALNLGNINASAVRRGDWICSTEMTVTSVCIDVQLRLLRLEQPALKHWQQVQIHAGAAVFTARVALYETRQLSAGEHGFAQLVLEKPQHLLFTDRFILRDNSATRTIGGGTVVDPFANRSRAHRKNRLPVLAALLHADPVKALREAVVAAPAGIDSQEFEMGRNLAETTLKQFTDHPAIMHYTAAAGRTLFLNRQSVENAQSTMAAKIASYHEEQPHSAGISPRELGQALGQLPDLVLVALDLSTKAGVIERVAGKRIRLTGFRPVLDSERQQLLNDLIISLTPTTLKPPSASVLAEQLELTRDELESQVTPLVEHGSLIQVARNRYYHPQALEQLARFADELTEENPVEGFSAKHYAGRSGIGRNLTIDVLEYFDRVGVTRQHNTELKTRVVNQHGPDSQAGTLR